VIFCHSFSSALLISLNFPFLSLGFFSSRAPFSSLIRIPPIIPGYRRFLYLRCFLPRIIYHSCKPLQMRQRRYIIWYTSAPGCCAMKLVCVRKPWSAWKWARWPESDVCLSVAMPAQGKALEVGGSLSAAHPHVSMAWCLVFELKRYIVLHYLSCINCLYVWCTQTNTW
jgi:hypothetical protein